MLQLVSDLPAVFRRGAGSRGDGRDQHCFALASCQEAFDCLKPLEDLASKLGRAGLQEELAARRASPSPAADHAAPNADLRSKFLSATPDEGLELSAVWASARTWLEGQRTDLDVLNSDMEAEEDALVRQLSLDVLHRRCRVAEHWLLQRLSQSTGSSTAASLAILRPALAAELQMLRAVLGAVVAGPAGAEAVAAKAVAAREGAEAKVAAASAAATAAAKAKPVARASNQQRSSAAARPPRNATPPAPISLAPVSSAAVSAPLRTAAPSPPDGPTSSATEEIQRWLQNVRETGMVASGGNDSDWKHQLQVLRAGLTGTAVTLGGEPPTALPQLPAPRSSGASTDECPICLEPLGRGAASGKQAGLVPLPCGHTFHAACVSQWLQRCPRCPMCRHSPFAPLAKSEGGTLPAGRLSPVVGHSSRRRVLE